MCGECWTDPITTIVSLDMLRELEAVTRDSQSLYGNTS